jgi:hypothetical protein
MAIGPELAQRLALLSTGTFFGGALYSSWVEHPARLEAGMDAALRQFMPSFRRAARLQASTAVMGTLSALAAWLLGADSSWALSAAVLVLVIPISLVAVLPIHKQLQPLPPTDPRAKELLEKWGRLHFLRTIAGLLAFTMQIAAGGGR